MASVTSSEIHIALKAWEQGDRSYTKKMLNLYLVKEAIGLLPETSTLGARLALNTILETSLKKLAGHAPDHANILRLRFQNNRSVRQVTQVIHDGHMPLTIDRAKKMQSKAIKQLTAIIQQDEVAARQRHWQKTEGNLNNRSYNKLVGRQEIQQALKARLLSTHPHDAHIITVVAVGGSGKTALADATVRDILPTLYFEEIVWLRLEIMEPDAIITLEQIVGLLHQKLSFRDDNTQTTAQKQADIHRALKRQSHLIVIDNIENDLDSLAIDALNSWGNPSKFLLTSRVRLHKQAGVYNLFLNSLSLDDSRILLRNEARFQGLDDLAAAPDAILDEIYDLVGGLPLALKIIASLTLDFPLAQLLDDLKVVQIKTIEVDLYNHIYEKIWSVLGLHARQLLELMPMISQEGADQRQLLAISDLTQSQLNDAIQELRFRSLLETTGSLQTKFYRCHRLTETWIKSAIVRWPDTVT